MTTKGISAARLATEQMDELLQPAIDRLQRALNVTERSGIFSDVDAVLAALVDMKSAAEQAQGVARRTEWPLSPAARRRILSSHSAGLAQVERRASLPEMAVSKPHPAPPSDGGSS